MGKEVDLSQRAIDALAELDSAINPAARRKLINRLSKLDGRLFNQHRGMGNPIREKIEDCFDRLAQTGSAEDKAAIAKVYPA